MSTLTKLALHLMGRVGPRPGRAGAPATVALPPPDREGGTPLMQALARRHSSRAFRAEPLSLQQLSDLLWAADGINRPADREHTAPSAMNAQEIEIYAALAAGLYRYDAQGHALVLESAKDIRALTGLQEFVDLAPLDLIYVADHGRLKLVPEAARAVYAAACAGAIAQNVYLYCASAGLATVVRGWFDRGALEKALGLGSSRHVVLAQTVGFTA
ncbi:MAG: nitroreductase family protein [Betaproteobacteria bacterium]